MTVLELSPAARITAAARQVKFVPTVLLVVAGVLYGLGWVVAKSAGVLWLAIAWSGTAVRVGWTDARKPKAG